MAGIWSFRLKFLKNIYINYYSQKLVLFNFRGDNARVSQRVSTNLNVTVASSRMPTIVFIYQWCPIILQTQARKFEKQAKNRQFLQ